MSKNNKNYLKKTPAEVKRRSLPVLRPARLKCEAHKARLKKHHE